MSHTYVSDLVHCVFSTKERRNSIPAETQSELWSFIGGIARKNGFKGPDRRWNREPRTHLAVPAGHNSFGQGRATSEGFIFPVDE